MNKFNIITDSINEVPEFQKDPFTLFMDSEQQKPNQTKQQPQTQNTQSDTQFQSNVSPKPKSILKNGNMNSSKEGQPPSIGFKISSIHQEEVKPQQVKQILDQNSKHLNYQYSSQNGQTNNYNVNNNNINRNQSSQVFSSLRENYREKNKNESYFRKYPSSDIDLQTIPLQTLPDQGGYEVPKNRFSQYVTKNEDQNNNTIDIIDQIKMTQKPIHVFQSPQYAHSTSYYDQAQNSMNFSAVYPNQQRQLQRNSQIYLSPLRLPSQQNLYEKDHVLFHSRNISQDIPRDMFSQQQPNKFQYLKQNYISQSNIHSNNNKNHTYNHPSNLRNSNLFMNQQNQQQQAQQQQQKQQQQHQFAKPIRQIKNTSTVVYNYNQQKQFKEYMMQNKQYYSNNNSIHNSSQKSAQLKTSQFTTNATQKSYKTNLMNKTNKTTKTQTSVAKSILSQPTTNVSRNSIIISEGLVQSNSNLVNDILNTSRTVISGPRAKQVPIGDQNNQDNILIQESQEQLLAEQQQLQQQQQQQFLQEENDKKNKSMKSLKSSKTSKYSLTSNQTEKMKLKALMEKKQQLRQAQKQAQIYDLIFIKNKINLYIQKYKDIINYIADQLMIPQEQFSYQAAKLFVIAHSQIEQSGEIEHEMELQPALSILPQDQGDQKLLIRFNHVVAEKLKLVYIQIYKDLAIGTSTILEFQKRYPSVIKDYLTLNIIASLGGKKNLLKYIEKIIDAISKEDQELGVFLVKKLDSITTMVTDILDNTLFKQYNKGQTKNSILEYLTKMDFQQKEMYFIKKTIFQILSNEDIHQRILFKLIEVLQKTQNLIIKQNFNIPRLAQYFQKHPYLMQVVKDKSQEAIMVLLQKTLDTLFGHETYLQYENQLYVQVDKVDEKLCNTLRDFLISHIQTFELQQDSLLRFDIYTQFEKIKYYFGIKVPIRKLNSGTISKYIQILSEDLREEEDQEAINNTIKQNIQQLQQQQQQIKENNFFNEDLNQLQNFYEQQQVKSQKLHTIVKKIKFEMKKQYVSVQEFFNFEFLNIFLNLIFSKYHMLNTYDVKYALYYHKLKPAAFVLQVNSLLDIIEYSNDFRAEEFQSIKKYIQAYATYAYYPKKIQLIH